MFENFPEELLEASQSFLAMDPPRHTKLRKLVSAAFTPRQVRRIEDSIQANAKTIVAIPQGTARTPTRANTSPLVSPAATGPTPNRDARPPTWARANMPIAA